MEFILQITVTPFRKLFVIISFKAFLLVPLTMSGNLNVMMMIKIFYR